MSKSILGPLIRKPLLVPMGAKLLEPGGFAPRALTGSVLELEFHAAP